MGAGSTETGPSRRHRSIQASSTLPSTWAAPSSTRPRCRQASRAAWPWLCARVGGTNRASACCSCALKGRPQDRGYRGRDRPEPSGRLLVRRADTNRDGRIEIAVEAAPQAADRNTILNGLWVFAANTQPDSEALLTGALNARALARLSATHPGGPARNDLILVRVTNTGREPQVLRPRLIVDTALPFAFQPEAGRAVSTTTRP